MDKYLVTRSRFPNELASDLSHVVWVRVREEKGALLMGFGGEMAHGVWGALSP